MSDAFVSRAGWAVPGTLLKVAASGYAMYTHCHPDGTVTERSVRNWDEVWVGHWVQDAVALTIAIGPYELRVPSGSNRGIESEPGNPSALPTDFYVLPVVPTPHAPVAPGECVALVKLPPRNVNVAELLPDGSLQEYPLLDGWDADQWGGTWEAGDGGLTISVGGYRWQDELRDARGFFHGRETFEGQPDSVFGAVCVRLVRSQTRFPLLGAPDRERLFDAGGYSFYALPGAPRGYFAQLLEARKPGMTPGLPQRFAAKCVRAGRFDEISRREIAFAREFSATDGLIAAFESFALPSGPEFGEFADCTVQIMELGETDLSHFTRGTGPMGIGAVLTIARDLAGALAAMHGKFRCVHSDVRSANVIGIRTGDQLSWRLADFNVTTRLSAKTDWAPYVGGTAICTSPSMVQRLAAAGVQPRTKPSDDVWALGVLLAQCALGSEFHLGMSVTVDVANDLIDSAPGALSEILRICLTEGGQERATAEDVHTLAVAALAQFLVAAR
ncbi:protein kinase domain-containing protein [Pengzhenrongella phosphoraccumulans]|uniref:protein kinase domain-containing protein n=1 Tax=Pengzhenrongella phosphoraccumulans TaxID=3114394 RepID=UPI00388E99E5